MRVIISAGGTGGHIYPALSIVNALNKKEPNSEFLYIGTHNRMEKDIVPKRGIKYEALEIYGFNKRDILFIDDSKNNIEVAKKIGWNTLLCTGLDLDTIKEECLKFIGG